MVADPVASVRALLLRPEGDDGLRAQQARDGGVQAEPRGARPLRLLQRGADQQGGAVELQIQPAQVDLAQLGCVAGAQREAADLRRLGPRVQRQPGARGVQRELQPLRSRLPARRGYPGLAGHVEVRLGRIGPQALDQHPARGRVEGSPERARLEGRGGAPQSHQAPPSGQLDVGSADPAVGRPAQPSAPLDGGVEDGDRPGRPHVRKHL